MYDRSHRDYLRSGYLHRLLRLLIITVITPLPTKPSDKNARELKLANAANYRHADASADVAALDAKYMKELADAKAENDVGDDVAADGPFVALSKQSVSQCVKPPRPPAWIMQPPPDWQTPLTGIISPSERG